MGNELLRNIKKNKEQVEEKLGIELNKPPNISNKRNKENLKKIFIHHVQENKNYRSRNKPILRIVRYRGTESKVKVNSRLIKKTKLMKQYELRLIKNLINNRRKKKEEEHEHQKLKESIRNIKEQEL